MPETAGTLAQQAFKREGLPRRSIHTSTQFLSLLLGSVCVGLRVGDLEALFIADGLPGHSPAGQCWSLSLAAGDDRGRGTPLAQLRTRVNWTSVNTGAERIREDS
jgi:hypothetical protein